MATRLSDSTTGGPIVMFGHEVAVHHVDVNQIGAAALDGGDRVAERREVGGQDRRARSARSPADLERDRLAGRDLEAACGLWRSTMPAATPGYGFEPTTATRKP